MSQITEFDELTLKGAFTVDSETDVFQVYTKLNELVGQTSVITGAVAPTFKAIQHQWYLDTATNKYYRNVDGGTTWVALN